MGADTRYHSVCTLSSPFSGTPTIADREEGHLFSCDARNARARNTSATRVAIQGTWKSQKRLLSTEQLGTFSASAEEAHDC
ncbi:unnamed protein product [Zymoseptoria tritici ST99CH_3D1]|nr:unnamed protein product [Zymoseptoria tritici ST99CH_3D1]